MTFTEIAQLSVGASDPPVKVMLEPPKGAVNVPPQPFEVTALATVTPAGSALVNCRPDTGVGSVFATVWVRVDRPPGTIEAGEKATVNEGGVPAVRTLRVRGAELLVGIVAPSTFPLSPEEVIEYSAAVVASTLTLTVQILPAPSVRTEGVPGSRVIDWPPVAATTEPPQVVTAPLGVATSRPAGKVVLNAPP